MKIRGHGSAVAVVLSVLAVAVAGGGTAVAVSSAVNIADPTTPSRIAKVDPAGRLSVGGATSTVDAAGYLYGYTDQSVTVVTSPTTATLAISRIHLSNPTANGTAAEQQLALGKYPVGTDGTCATTSTPVLVARYDLAPGDDVDDVVPAPIVVKPTGTAKYCLAVQTTYLGSASDSPAFYLVYNIAAYVTGGSYTGIGTGAGAAAANQPGSAKTGR